MSPAVPIPNFFSARSLYRAILKKGFPLRIRAAGPGIDVNLESKDDARQYVPEVLKSASAVGHGVVVLP